MMQQFAEKAVKALETGIKLAETQGVDITKEILNYALFCSLFNVIKILAFSSLLYLVIRGINLGIKFAKEEESVYRTGKGNDKEVANFSRWVYYLLSAAKYVFFVIGATYIITQIATPVKDAAKILIAPKVFLIEKGTDYYKDFQKLQKAE